jgi:acyl dehydratase
MKRFSILTVMIVTVFLLAVPGFAQSSILDLLSDSYWKSGNGISNRILTLDRNRERTVSRFKSAEAMLVSTTIVISEFRTRGPNGASDEFVEICNISADAIDISGYRLNGSNNAGTTSLRATVPANTTLPAGGRFLFTNSSAGGYSGTVAGNVTYTTGITDDGGLAILTPAVVVVDQVGMSAGSAYKEGTTLAPTTTNVNQSYERKPGGTTSALQDTDNNATDFQLNAATSNPQNNSLRDAPTNLSFGSIEVGQSATLIATINSTISTTIRTPVISGTNAAEFSAATPTPSTGTSFTIPVTFTPQSNGGKTAVLNVSTVHGSVSVQLSGTGTAAVPTLAINDVSQSEGNAGTTNFTFTVSINTATHGGVTFDIATADGTATDDNPTTEDNDYAANSLTGQFIPNGTQTYSFTVAVNGDSAVEPDETFFVNVTSVTGANATDGQGQGTINNDDVAGATVGFADSGYTEDESQIAFVTVVRAGDLSGTTTVDYSTQAPGAGRGSVPAATGGASCDTPGVDFINQSGTLVFEVEDDFKQIEIQLCRDTIIEQNEAFNVYLSNVTNGTLGGIPTTQVLINDTANEFYNTEPIFIGTGGDSYESSIEVSGVPTNIGGLRVTLFDFNHLTADDIDVLLVGPQGQKFLLMGDAGGDDGLVEGATITFSDNAGQVLPDSFDIFTGIYEPTTWIAGQTSFPAPAPPAPYAEPGSEVGGAVTLASVFGNTNANGTWTLYIRDDNNAFQKLGADGVVSGGWGLQFLAPTAAGVSVGGSVRAGKTPVKGVTVMLTGGNLTEPLVTKTNTFGNYRFEGLPVGETYIVTVISNRYNFPQSSIVLNVSESVDGADFEAEDR